MTDPASLIESLQAENAELKDTVASRDREIDGVNRVNTQFSKELSVLRATAELVEKWKESAGLARYYLESYSDDADNATHAKRVLDNALEALGEAG